MGGSAHAKQVPKLRIVPRTPGWQLVVFSALIISLQLTTAAQGPQRPRTLRLPWTGTVLETGWKLIVAADGRCFYTVPESWPVSGDGRQTVSPDGAMWVYLSATYVRSWSEYRETVKTAMQPAIVHVDVFSRLWVERIEGSRSWQHVLAGDRSNVCTADIETRSRERAADVVQKIASSVGVAHDGDREWTKR